MKKKVAVLCVWLMGMFTHEATEVAYIVLNVFKRCHDPLVIVWEFFNLIADSF